MAIEVTAPCVMTPNGFPGVSLTDGEKETFISIAYDGEREKDGRNRYRYWIKSGNVVYSNNDLRSGIGGGTLQEGLSSLLSFLCAAAAGYRHRKMAFVKGDNEIFPRDITEWAYLNAEDLEILVQQIAEGISSGVTYINERKTGD